MVRNRGLVESWTKIRNVQHCPWGKLESSLVETWQVPVADEINSQKNGRSRGKAFCHKGDAWCSVSSFRCIHISRFFTPESVLEQSIFTCKNRKSVKQLLPGTKGAMPLRNAARLIYTLSKQANVSPKLWKYLREAAEFFLTVHHKPNYAEHRGSIFYYPLHEFELSFSQSVKCFPPIEGM